MKDADRVVEKVLDGLRGAPPPGLESRVLRAVRERERRVTPVFWKRPAFAVPAGALATVAIVGLLSMVWQEHTRPDAGLRTQVLVLAAPRLPDLALPLSVAPMPAVKLSAAARGVPHRAAAERVSREVSYPPPPLPLTEQERLLLQVAHHRTAEAVESLTTETLVAQAARDKEEFSRFFEPEHGGTNQ